MAEAARIELDRQHGIVAREDAAEMVDQPKEGRGIKHIDIDTVVRLDTAAHGRQQVRVGLDPLVFGIDAGLRL